MAGVPILDLIPILQQPGLMPGMEEECEQLLQLFRAILPVLPVAVHTLIDSIVFSHEGGEYESWLRDLNAAAYEVDDIVDEFRYAKLRAEAETNHHHSVDKVRTSIFSLCKLNCGMREKLPIKEGMRERLTGLVIRIQNLLEMSTHFINQDSQGLVPGAESREGPILSSLKEIDAIIVGRDKDKERIVNMLLHSDTVGDTNTIAVITIHGWRGAGKTTLARFTCADARIKDNFEVILWVDVGGENIDVPKIAKSVIDQVIGKDCCISEGDPDLLQRRIYQELSGKRFLLVLDDVGGEEQNVDQLKWEQLKSWLEQSAAIRSSLIVTTYVESVADIMSSAGGYKMSISDLREDDLWTLFFKRAFFADEKISPEVLEISQQILKKCYDSPLLVNLMGGLMRFKKELAEWQQVKHQLNSIHVINLCIAHLSPETRECFTFCSVFPEGHYMDKEVLVKLWMANGLISSDITTSVEEKVNRIFNEIALRQLFEDVKLVPESSSRDKHGYRSRVICRLHPGIRDWANYYNLQYGFSSISRPDRFQFILGDSPVDIPVLLKNYPDVRILIYSNDPFIRTVKCSELPNSNSLRALHLPSALFDRDLFELKYTKHLRYLDLSGSRIKRLPESTSSLYFIQTLNLSKCLLLDQLPEDMRYMRNLRHLHVDKCPKLKKMPLHLRQLSCLRILTTYIVGESAGNGIDELKYLNLSGLLEIYNLRNVKDATIAKKAGLFSKTNLEQLTLCWGRQQLVMSKGHNDSEVLEALQPHNGLKVLKIQQYGGNEFANWITNPVDLQNLVELHLIGCSQCSTIPPVWKVRSLRVLCLKYMINLTCMYNFTSFPGIDKKDSSELFPSLKRLVLVGLKRLERWHKEEGMQRTIPSFPVLDEMEITNCPELKSMPSVPVLKYLTISIENHGLLLSTIDLITQSQSLVEVSMAKASDSDDEALLALGPKVKGRNSDKLRVMRLESTNSFFMARAIPRQRLGFWRSLVSLENLDIFNCSSIFAWPLEEFTNLHKLKRLSFRKCPNLTGLNPNQLQKDEKVLPLLQYLEFYACPSLKEVPRCTSILFLELDECPEINSISGFNNLKMVYLSCLNWTSLPTGFQDLEKLESLRVSECYCLTCLPVELAGLTSLRTLIIDKCSRVHCLPNDLDQMLSGLEKFQISECPDLEKFCKEGLYSSIISQIGMRRNNSAGPYAENNSPGPYVENNSAGPSTEASSSGEGSE